MYKLFLDLVSSFTMYLLYEAVYEIMIIFWSSNVFHTCFQVGLCTHKYVIVI